MQLLQSKALREQRNKLAARIKEMADKIHAEGRDFSAEEQPNWEAVNKDYDALTKRIEIAERGETVSADQLAIVGDPRVGRGSYDGRDARLAGDDGAAVAVTEQHRVLALQAWTRYQMGEDLSEAQSAACRIVGLNPARRQLVMPLMSTERYEAFRRGYNSVHPTRAAAQVQNFRADLSDQVGTSGGYMVPPETLIRELEINLLYYGGMRQVSDSIRTTTGERLSWPTVDDTTNTGAQLGETASIGTSTDPSFGKVYWDAYKFSSKPVLIPYELLQDSVFNLPQVLGNLLGVRLGRITNTKFTTGSGAATPKGLITCAATKAAASSTAIAGDDIINLYHAVNPSYRTGFGFMMHDSILLSLRQLKDGLGRYLWQSGLDTGVPDRLLGCPITINQDMDNTIASGKNTIAGGQLSKYKIRTVGEVRMYRLQERYRDTDEDAFLAFMREDGNMLDAGTHPVYVLHHT